jgi:hypothetical protein
VTLVCRQIAPATVPAPPGTIVGETVFRLDASPSEGGALPGPVRLQVTYPPDAVPPAERGRLALAYLDGSAWEPLPDQVADPAASQISAIVDRAGTYALYRQTQ